MIKIAIVEDEAAVRDQLTDYVRRYTRQYGTEFEVTCFTDGDEILENYRPAFDIIFLDVEMKHLDGMETARRIRERDGGVLIVFITNMAQYAIRGYAVGALDYVWKASARFREPIQMALHRLAAGAARQARPLASRTLQPLPRSGTPLLLLKLATPTANRHCRTVIPACMHLLPTCTAARSMAVTTNITLRTASFPVKCAAALCRALRKWAYMFTSSTLSATMAKLVFTVMPFTLG